MNFKNKIYNPALGILHLFLLTISGWALKHVTETARFSLAAFSLLLMLGLIGVITFHPNGGHNQVLRKINALTSFYAQLSALPLVIADILHILQRFNSIWFCITIITAITAALTHGLRQRLLNVFIIDAAVLWNIAMLAYIAFSLDECYWTHGLVVLVLLNHFGLQRLALHYDISHLEITTIGFCFFVMFALNSINEIAAAASFTIKHSSCLTSSS